MYYIVGCGSLGSTISVELSKRSLATGKPLNITIIDDDDIEERNVVAQNFNPKHIGQKKAQVISDICNEYETVTSTPVIKRLNSISIQELVFTEDDTIIDCVDNLETRQFLWLTGVSKSIPVCHVGMETNGTGVVQWSYYIEGQPVCDNFSLSPKIINKNKATVEPRRLAPCELSSQRTLILNTSLAAMIALSIQEDNDSSNFIGLGERHTDGVMASFFTTKTEIKELQQMRIDPKDFT